MFLHASAIRGFPKMGNRQNHEFQYQNGLNLNDLGDTPILGKLHLTGMGSNWVPQIGVVHY